MDKTRKEKVKLAIQRARKDLVSFRKIMLSCGDDEVEPADFHYKWSESLLNDTSNEAIQGFRESAKTQYVLRSFPLYSLAFPSQKSDYIVLIKNNTTLARNKLKEIEIEYTTNPVLLANMIKIYEQSGDVFSVDVRDSEENIINIRIEAYGKGASIRGLANRDRRPKIVIIDDPQDLEDAKSETVQAGDWEWFLSDVMFLGQHTRIFLIGNNLGDKCIIERVFNNAENLGFHTDRVPTETPEGNSAWASKYTIKAIREEKDKFSKMGKLDVWLREKMCISVSEKTRIFQEDDYRYFPVAFTKRILKDCNRWMTLDPASSLDIKSCYRAFVVNAVDSKNKWNIVEIKYGRWDSDKLIDVMFELVVKWQLKDVGIEKGMLEQVLKPFIYKEMAKRNIFFNIIPLEHARQGTKLERIKLLQPRFKAHQIWFMEDASWLPELKAELRGVTKDEIKSLYIDLVDALAMQMQIAKAPFNTKENKIVTEHPYKGFTGGVAMPEWMRNG